MARLSQSGAEVAIEEIGILGTVTRDASVFRSGVASFKCDSTGANAQALAQFRVGISGTVLPATSTRYFRAYMRFDAAPASTIAVLVAGQSNLANGISARLTAAGKLQLWGNTGAVQLGSDSSATLLMDGSTWYRIEIFTIKDGSNQITDYELRLDGTTVASGSGATLGTLATTAFAGWQAPPGASKVCYVDDMAINDASGAANNSWPGSGKIVQLLPISDSAIGGWTGGAGGVTNLFAAVDNTPPVGAADPGTNTSQIRNATANNSYDANLTSYTTAGVGASDTVNAVVPMCNVGAPSATGAKSGSFGIVSNPAITNRVFTGGSGTATFFWRGTAVAAYPTNWGWEVGTVTDTPSVTLGTSPVARLTITAGTTTRIAICDSLGLSVDYTPAAVAGALAPPEDVTLQAVNRASVW